MRKERNLLMDVTSEVGAVGGCVWLESVEGRNWVPLVIVNRLSPKQDVVKSH